MFRITSLLVLCCFLVANVSSPQAAAKDRFNVSTDQGEQTGAVTAAFQQEAARARGLLPQRLQTNLRERGIKTFLVRNLDQIRDFRSPRGLSGDHYRGMFADNTIYIARESIPFDKWGQESEPTATPLNTVARTVLHEVGHALDDPINVEGHRAHYYSSRSDFVNCIGHGLTPEKTSELQAAGLGYFIDPKTQQYRSGELFAEAFALYWLERNADHTLQNPRNDAFLSEFRPVVNWVGQQFSAEESGSSQTSQLAAIEPATRFTSHQSHVIYDDVSSANTGHVPSYPHEFTPTATSTDGIIVESAAVSASLVQWNGIAQLHLFVPRDAEVRIDDRPTTSRGAYRLYQLLRVPPTGRRQFRIQVSLPSSYGESGPGKQQTVEVKAGDEVTLRVPAHELLPLGTAISAALKTSKTTSSVPSAEAPTVAINEAPQPPVALTAGESDTESAPSGAAIVDPAAIKRVFEFGEPVPTLSAQIEFGDQLRAQGIRFDGRVPPPAKLGVADTTVWDGTKVSFEGTLELTLTAQAADSEEFAIKFKTKPKIVLLKFAKANETWEIQFIKVKDSEQKDSVEEWITESLKGEVEPKGGVFKSHQIEQLKITRKFKTGKFEVAGSDITLKILP